MYVSQMQFLWIKQTASLTWVWRSKDFKYQACTQQDLAKAMLTFHCGGLVIEVLLNLQFRFSWLPEVWICHKMPGTQKCIYWYEVIINHLGLFIPYLWFTLTIAKRITFSIEINTFYIIDYFTHCFFTGFTHALVYPLYHILVLWGLCLMDFYSHSL
jgi:hypothetical protein